MDTKVVKSKLTDYDRYIIQKNLDVCTEAHGNSCNSELSSGGETEQKNSLWNY